MGYDSLLMDEADQDSKKKYGASEDEVSRFAQKAQDRAPGSTGKQLPAATNYSSQAAGEGDAGAPPKSSAQLNFGPDNPSAMADHNEEQAALYKPELGNLPDDTDPNAGNPLMAEASGKGKPGEHGATLSDLMTLA